ncbi:hypothetical protein C8R44DRAFT_887841 [Mycena epipterygia]|nr:hypothetical protein C8R44DRAFT_887841 [Mycena epipterygia]
MPLLLCLVHDRLCLAHPLRPVRPLPLLCLHLKCPPTVCPHLRTWATSKATPPLSAPRSRGAARAGPTTTLRRSPTANTTANNGDDYGTHPSLLRFLHPDDYVPSTCVFYLRTTTYCYVFKRNDSLFLDPGLSIYLFDTQATNQTTAPPTAPRPLGAARSGTWGVWRGPVRCVGMVGEGGGRREPWRA